MNEKHEMILDAAMRVFTRYGMRRTTMADIASEAGIVRQTLYNAFPGKNEVVKGVINAYVRRALAAITAEAEGAPGLSDRLDIFFNHIVVRPFEMLQASPDAADMIDGFNEAGREEINRADKAKRAMLVQLLAPWNDAIERCGHTPEAFAAFVLNSAVAIKKNAESEDELAGLLAVLKTMITAICTGQATETGEQS